MTRNAPTRLRPCRIALCHVMPDHPNMNINGLASCSVSYHDQVLRVHIRPRLLDHHHHHHHHHDSVRWHHRTSDTHPCVPHSGWSRRGLPRSMEHTKAKQAKTKNINANVNVNVSVNEKRMGDETNGGEGGKWKGQIIPPSPPRQQDCQRDCKNYRQMPGRGDKTNADLAGPTYYCCYFLRGRYIATLSGPSFKLRLFLTHPTK